MLFRYRPTAGTSADAHKVLDSASMVNYARGIG